MPSTIPRCRAVLAVHYTKGFAGPALYAGLYRCCMIHRAIQSLHCMQGLVGTAINAVLYRPCT